LLNCIRRYAPPNADEVLVGFAMVGGQTQRARSLFVGSRPFGEADPGKVEVRIRC
jgi:hypothetical protein